MDSRTSATNQIFSIKPLPEALENNGQKTLPETLEGNGQKKPLPEALEGNGNKNKKRPTITSRAFVNRMYEH